MPKDDPQWRGSGSSWIGKTIVRTVLNEQGTIDGVTHLTVFGWLPADESEFLDDAGKPAPLYRAVHFSEELKGDVEDLEEYELAEAKTHPDEWRRSGSDWLGRTITRTVMTEDNQQTQNGRGAVCGWLPATESEFISVRSIRSRNVRPLICFCLLVHVPASVRVCI